jgi:hypothetical protein
MLKLRYMLLGCEMGSCALGQDLVPRSSKNASTYSVSIKGADIFNWLLEDVCFS